MKVYLPAALLLVAGVTLHAEPLPVAKAETVGMSSQRLARIGSVLGAEVGSGRLPGAVVAVARKGKLVYYEAFGFLDKASNTAMPKDAIFHIASMTKPLTAVGALMLYEENRLLVNDPVGQYVPQLDRMPVAIMDSTGQSIVRTEPARRKPTLQDLMRHTAGLSYGNASGNELEKKYPTSSDWSSATLTADQFLATLGALPLHYQPGSRWDYSLGFDVLGLVLEAVTKQSLGEFLDERLFKPLGMADTGFVTTAENAKRFARPLPTNPDTGAPTTWGWNPTQRRKFDCGGGCGYGTAADYLRFAQMLLNGGTLEGTRVLGRKTVEYMTADHIGPEVGVTELRDYPNINGYGFGLSVAVRRGFGVAGIMGSPGDYHWGGGSGTYFWVDPREQLAVVFMAATPGAARLRYRQEITSLVLAAITD